MRRSIGRSRSIGYHSLCWLISSLSASKRQRSANARQRSANSARVAVALLAQRPVRARQAALLGLDRVVDLGDPLHPARPHAGLQVGLDRALRSAGRGSRSASRGRSSRRDPSSPGVPRHCDPSRLILERRGYEPKTMNRSHSGCPDRDRRRLRRRPRPRAPDDLSSLPLSGASRGQTKAVNDGARQALQEAGGMAGGQAIKFVTLNDATKQAGTGCRSWWRERAPRRAGRRRVAVIGAVQLRRGGGDDPDHQRGRHPGDQPVEHRTSGSRRGGPGDGPGRAGQVLPDRRAHLLPHHAQRQGPGRRAGDGDARRGCKTVDRRPRRRGLRQGRRDADARGRVARLGHEGRARPSASARRRGASARSARTASPTPASRPTAPSGCSAPRPARRSCSAPTASPSPASRDRLPAAVAKRMTVVGRHARPRRLPGRRGRSSATATRTRSTATRR